MPTLAQQLVPDHVDHGTSLAYGYYRCRCQECRTAHGVQGRAYRERNRARFQAQRRAEYAANPERFKANTRAHVERRRQIIGRYKTLTGCLLCGYRKHALALQLHHRDPAHKEFSVSMGLGRSWALVKAEVAKCDVLCANCHAVLEGTKWAT